MHAAPLPLVEAGLRHALDTWEWVLELDAGAGEAVQLAALFHDVERLFREAEPRVGQPAADDQALEDAHAQCGAQIASQLLVHAGYDASTRHRVAALIARHERPPHLDDDPELTLLRDADALAFLARDLPGFLADHGPEHTRRTLAWTLGRLSETAHRWAQELELAPQVRRLFDELATAARGTTARAPRS